MVKMWCCFRIILNSVIMVPARWYMPPADTKPPVKPEPVEEISFKIGITLEGEMAKKFWTIKHRYGLQSNADMLRLLISQKFEELLIRESSPFVTFPQKSVTGP